MKIQERILACIRDVETVAKNGSLKVGGMEQYKYMKAEDVIDAAKKVFVKHGVIMTICNDIHIERTLLEKTTSKGSIVNNHFFVIHGTAKFINASDATDFIEVLFLGSGEDAGDKGIGKALTYAKKYAIMNTLLIQDEVDSDVQASEESSIKSLSHNQSQTKKKALSICLSAADCEDPEGMVKRNYKKQHHYKHTDIEVWQRWFDTPEESEREISLLKNKGWNLNKETFIWEKKQ